MTVIIENDNKLIISTAAHLIADDRECASEWASSHIQPNSAIKWILGNYVEADNANSNKQFWAYDDLMLARPTVAHAPLNILHRPKHIVGAFVATEMIYPKGASEEASENNPYIEALAAFWKPYFPDELAIVEMAHNQGALFFSMECVAETITCAGEAGCSKEFKYAGALSPSYCDHLNQHASVKQLNKPHFLAGALIFPPSAPGWKGASVKELAELFKKYEEKIPSLYNAIKADADHLSELEIEEVVGEHLQHLDDASSDDMKTDEHKYKNEKLEIEKKKKRTKLMAEKIADDFVAKIRR